MIVAVNLSPSLDRTIELNHLAAGHVQRVDAARLDPGDNEVDVAAVPVLGHPRSNITFAELDGTVTKLDERGASLAAVDREALAARPGRHRPLRRSHSHPSIPAVLSPITQGES